MYPDCMQFKPTEIRRIKGIGLSVRWSDGRVDEISNLTLRTNCPCASCREAKGDTSHALPLTGNSAAPKKKSLLKVIEHSATEELTLVQIWGIGNYALGVSWADGHNSGIYSFEVLRELADLALAEASALSAV